MAGKPSSGGAPLMHARQYLKATSKSKPKLQQTANDIKGCQSAWQKIAVIFFKNLKTFLVVNWKNYHVDVDLYHKIFMKNLWMSGAPKAHLFQGRLSTIQGHLWAEGGVQSPYSSVYNKYDTLLHICGYKYINTIEIHTCICIYLIIWVNTC